TVRAGGGSVSSTTAGSWIDGGRAMDGILNDLKFSLRTLLKDRGFAAVAVLTLALGIGANTAVYSLTDQILLRRLPVRNPDELVILRMPGPKSGHVSSDIDEGA